MRIDLLIVILCEFVLPFEEHLVGVVDTFLDELSREHDIFVVKEFGYIARVNVVHFGCRLLDEMFLSIVLLVALV